MRNVTVISKPPESMELNQAISWGHFPPYGQGQVCTCCGTTGHLQPRAGGLMVPILPPSCC